MQQFTEPDLGHFDLKLRVNLYLFVPGGQTVLSGSYFLLFLTIHSSS